MRRGVARECALAVAVMQKMGGTASQFYASAAKIIAINAAKRTINRAPASPPTVDVTNTGNSTINGRSLAAGGNIAAASVPDGMSRPLNANSKWIITKPAATQTSSNLTFAPGNSKLFRFTGQKFDFKASNAAGLSFSLRWSTDNGLTWSEGGPYVITQVCWCLVDFGSAAARVVEIIGEDEIFQINSFDFDTGTAPPSSWSDAMIPVVTMFGDSYVFSQGAGTPGVANNERATQGMCRQLAEYLGFLQIGNNGFRTNGFSNDHAAVQSKFKDRIDIPAPADNALSEGITMGVNDAVIIPGTINDQSIAYDAVRYQDVVDALTRLRAKQPNALILFPFGMGPPQYTEPAQWATDYRNAFKAVFGNTPTDWIANGAWMIDRSRNGGSPVIASGTSTSSIYYPGANASGYLDVDHPNAAGHAMWAQIMGDGLLYLAQQVVAGVAPANHLLAENGTYLSTETSNRVIQG